MEQMAVLLGQFGLALVFVNVLLAQGGVPLPAIPILVVAGAFVSQGQIALAPLVLVAVVASLIGDTLWYLAGRRHGYRILRTLCRVAIEPDSCVKQTETIFERWGAPSLMLAKYVPGFATIAPPLAGAMGLAPPPFLAYSAFAALLWAGLPIALGAVFHAEVERALEWLGSMGTGAVAIIGAVVLLYIGVKIIQRTLLIRFLRMVRIDAEELRGLMGREPKPAVLDVRSATARKLDPRRLPGAVAVDFETPQAALVAVPPDRDVIVYCS
ncbi:MAG: VTT domain-containing protein [Burkholderiales bacterium]